MDAVVEAQGPSQPFQVTTELPVAHNCQVNVRDLGDGAVVRNHARGPGPQGAEQRR